MSESKPLSIRDIADMAGVSIATVSRVINNNGRFSEATRQRVQDIIDEHGYVANMAAKTLRESRSKTIGMIVPDISNDYFATLVLHVEQYLSGKGYSVFVCNTGNNPERERGHIRSLASKRADGILCISGGLTIGTDAIPGNIPVVCIDRYPDSSSDIPHVVSANEEGGRIATEHLIAQGCKRILHITGSIDDKARLDRERGYREALEAHELARSAAVLQLSGEKPSAIETKELLSAYIDEGNAFDGIFAASDHSAVGALHALKEHGIDVPSAVKLVGFDNSVYSRITTPALSTIGRHPEQLAELGCQALLDCIEKKGPQLETEVPVYLIERESSAQSS